MGFLERIGQILRDNPQILAFVLDAIIYIIDGVLHELRKARESQVE